MKATKKSMGFLLNGFGLERRVTIRGSHHQTTHRSGYSVGTRLGSVRLEVERPGIEQLGWSHHQERQGWG